DFDFTGWTLISNSRRLRNGSLGLGQRWWCGDLGRGWLLIRLRLYGGLFGFHRFLLGGANEKILIAQ
ncbi:MAG: hypothetical protein AB1Z31_26005, partial [Desulfobacterales bacterium]